MADTQPTRLERLQAQLKAEQEKLEADRAARVARATKAKANAEPKLEHAKNRAAHWAAQVELLEQKVQGYDAVIGGTSTEDVVDEPADAGNED